MAYIHLFQNEKWWSHSSYSYGYISMEYSHWREGANQCYKINYSAGVSSGAYYKNGINIYVILDGVSHCIASGVGTNNSGSWYQEGSGTYSIANKTSGHTGFYAAVYDAKTGTLLWAGGTANLNVDPAQANFTAHSIASRTETTVTVNWNADAACDAIQYSLNGGGWINASGHPNYTVSGLTHGTSYTIKSRIRRADSQLWTESGTLSFSTYYYPHCTASPNFTIGNQVTLTIYNPLGRSIQIYMVGANGTTQGGDTITGTSISGYNNANWQDWWYSTVPNSNKGTYQVQVKYGSVTMTRSNAGTYDVTNSNPTFASTQWNYEDINSKVLDLTGNNQILVKNYSTVRGVITSTNKATAKNYATMSKYQLAIGGQTPKESSYSNSSTVYVGNLTANSNVLSMYAIDSRGNSTLAQRTVSSSNYKEYFDISIDTSKTKATRKDKVGSETILNVEGKIWNASFGKVANSINTFTVEYKKTNQTDEHYKLLDVTKPTLNGNAFKLNTSIKGDLEADGFTATESFNIRVKITDALSPSTYVMTLESGTPNLAVHKNGVAINQPYDTDIGGALQVNGNVSATNLPIATTYDGVSFDDVASGGKLNKNFVGSVKVGETWYNLINIRHRNGESDGVNYGMQIRKPLTDKTGTLSVRGHSGGVWSDWETVYKAKELYTNTSGNAGTVTLNDNASNYAIVEIFYFCNRESKYWYGCTRVTNPNSKYFAMSNFIGYASDYTICKGAYGTGLINGTSITRGPNGNGQFEWGTGTTVSANNINSFSIHRVVGYK